MQMYPQTHCINYSVTRINPYVHTNEPMYVGIYSYAFSKMHINQKCTYIYIYICIHVGMYVCMY